MIRKFIFMLTCFVAFTQITLNQATAKDSERIRIPSHTGTVVQQYEADSNLNIVHIRDVHCNYHVQQNIASIIKLLVEDYGYTLITTEGAGGKIDTSAFSVLPDTSAKESVCIDYLKNGYLSGVEYLSILHPELPVKGYRGVEDPALYIENLSQFKSVTAGQDSVKKNIGSMLDELLAIALHIFPKDLFDFENEYRNYKYGTASIDRFMEYTLNTAERLNIDIKQYTDIQRYLSVIRFDTNPALLSAELYRYIAQFNLSANPSDIDILRKLYIDYTLRKIADEELVTRIRPYFADAMREYPAVCKFIEMVTAKQKIDYDILLDELDSLAVLCRNAIINQYDDADAIKKVWNSVSNDIHIVILYNKLSSLELTHNEYRLLIDADRSIDDLAVSIRELKKRFALTTPDLITGSDRIPTEEINTAYAFYRTADKRSCVMLSKLSNIMRTTDTNKAILLTGGFHSQVIEQQMKDLGISYTVIKPNIQPVDSAIYTSRMMQCSVSSILDINKTSSAAMYLSFPILFDTVLAQSEFFERIRSSFARRILTFKGIPLNHYYDSLQSDTDRELFTHLMDIGNLRFDMTTALGELLQTANLESVINYIMQYTDSVLRKEAESFMPDEISEEEIIKNQLFLADYMLSYLDYVIANTMQFPEIYSIVHLAGLYRNTNIPEMHILNTLVKKHLEEKLHDVLAGYIIFDRLASLPIDTQTDKHLFRQIAICPIVIKKIGFDDPAVVSLLNRVLQSVNEQLNTEYTIEWLIDVATKKTESAVPDKFKNASVVNAESVKEWAYAQADIITANHVENVYLPISEKKIADIKHNVRIEYEKLRSTIYAISEQHNIDLNDLISDITVMNWLFDEWDIYQGVSQNQILGSLRSLDMRFLRDNGFMIYMKQALQMKTSPVFMINRNIIDIQEVDKQLLEKLLSEMDIVPDPLLELFPEFEHIFMFSIISAVATAQERNIVLDILYHPIPFNKVFVHEFVGHKLLFVLIANALLSNDFTQMESLLPSQDMLDMLKTVLKSQYISQDMRMITRYYKKSMVASLNGDVTMVQTYIDKLPSIFKEYNAARPFRYRIRWYDDMIINISFDFLNWLSDNHKDAFWLLLISGMHFDRPYSFTFHSSKIGHMIHDFLFYSHEQVYLVAFVELIAYAMAYDRRPQYDTEFSYGNFDELTVSKIRHIFMKKMLGGWLWHPDKGWFYNRNPEEITASLTNLQGPEEMVRLSISKNLYFKHLYPTRLQWLTDLLVPAIKEKDLNKIRYILTMHYLEGWSVRQVFSVQQWQNYMANETIAISTHNFTENVSTGNTQVKQSISDTLFAIGIPDEPLLVEEITNVYESIQKTMTPVPMASFKHDYHSRKTLRNIMSSRHSQYFSSLIQLTRILDVQEPYVIPFLFSTQNIIMEYLDAKDQPAVKPIGSVKGYRIIGESL